MHHYKNHALDYIAKGMQVIPDRYGSKLPAVKAWNSTVVDEKQALEWINSMSESNIAVLTGEKSGVIALDLDCTDEKILAALEGLLPPSPVQRRGAKGWVRFFKYSGEQSYALKHNGEVVFEVLSDNKKCTIPGSKHPSGIDYTWIDKGLLDVDIKDLPKLPPFLITHVESKLRLEMPETEITKGKLINGRNDALSSLCGQLIRDKVPVDEAIKKLVEEDVKINEKPLFSDESELQHTERFTNALQFYSNHLSTVNGRRFRKNEAYEIPITASAINTVHAEEIEKKQIPLKANQESLKSIELPIANGLLGDIQTHILENSFIEQPAFAFSASLAIMSTLISRKLVFETASPNLYLLNIGPSGCGKDAPQQHIKDLLLRVNQDHLLGAGDYVSDASLTDSLAENPVRLDLVDECGGLLKNINSGGATFNGKMADILCELYTSSNSQYLGRATAEGRKGQCIRPNVIFLGSTTPAGFREGMTMRAIEKGLMGRMLIFQGESNKKASRVQKWGIPKEETLKALSFWGAFKPPINNGLTVGNLAQSAYEVESTEEAHKRLDYYFNFFDKIRISKGEDDSLLPIISRLYQQLCKVAVIHAASRVTELPKVDVEDVEFAYQTINYYFSKMEEFISTNIFINKNDEDLKNVIKKIKSLGSQGATQKDIYNATRSLERRQRAALVEDLIDNEEIIVDLEIVNGKQVRRYRSLT